MNITCMDLDTDPQGQIRKDSAWLNGILISLTDAASQADFLLRSMFASQEGCFYDSILLLLRYRLDSVHTVWDLTMASWDLITASNTSHRLRNSQGRI